MKKIFNRYFFISIGVLILIGFGIAFMMYNKPHRSAAKEKESYTLTAQQIFDEFASNEKRANALYLDKIVMLKGKVREVDLGQKTLILETNDNIFGVNCGMSKSEIQQLKKTKKGDWVGVKGICTGMLSDVVLTETIFVNTKLKTNKLFLICF